MTKISRCHESSILLLVYLECLETRAGKEASGIGKVGHACEL